MYNDDETICSSGVKVVDCPDCVIYWERENPSYLKFLQDVEDGKVVLDD